MEYRMSGIASEVGNIRVKKLEPGKFPLKEMIKMEELLLKLKDLVSSWKDYDQNRHYKQELSKFDGDFPTTTKRFPTWTQSFDQKN